MMANDTKTAEIAQILNISKKTVEQHQFNMRRKTGKKTTAGLIAWAVNEKIIENDVKKSKEDSL